MTGLARYLFGVEPAQMISTRTLGGEHWYMAADICGLIGTANYSSAVQNHLDDHEYRHEVIYTGRAKRRVLMVNDAGMLKLIRAGRTKRACAAYERALCAPAYLRKTQWPAGFEQAAA